jgi:hypothetical protein
MNTKSKLFIILDLMETVATMITNTLEWCLIKQISRMDLEELHSKIINGLLMGIFKMEKKPFIID